MNKHTKEIIGTIGMKAQYDENAKKLLSNKIFLAQILKGTVTVIAKIYLKWRNMELFQGVLGSLRPAVVALIASAGISILITAFWGNDMITFAGTNWGLVTIFVICIFLIQKVKMNPVWVMLLAGVMKVGVSCAQRL